MEDTKLGETTEFRATYGQHMQILVRSFQKMRQITIAAFVIHFNDMEMSGPVFYNLAQNFPFFG